MSCAYTVVYEHRAVCHPWACTCPLWGQGWKMRLILLVRTSKPSKRRIGCRSRRPCAQILIFCFHLLFSLCYRIASWNTIWKPLRLDEKYKCLQDSVNTFWCERRQWCVRIRALVWSEFQAKWFLRNVFHFLIDRQRWFSEDGFILF